MEMLLKKVNERCAQLGGWVSGQWGLIWWALLWSAAGTPRFEGPAAQYSRAKRSSKKLPLVKKAVVGGLTRGTSDTHRCARARVFRSYDQFTNESLAFKECVSEREQRYGARRIMSRRMPWAWTGVFVLRSTRRRTQSELCWLTLDQPRAHTSSSWCTLVYTFRKKK